MKKKDLTGLTPEVLAEIDNLKHLFFLSDYATLNVFLRFSGYKFPEDIDTEMFQGWNSEKKDYLERQKKQYDAVQASYVGNLNTRLAFANQLMSMLEKHVATTHQLDLDGSELGKVARAFAQIAAVQDQTVASMNITATLDGEYEETKEKVSQIIEEATPDIESEEDIANEQVDEMLRRNAELLKLRAEATPVYDTKKEKPNVIVKIMDGNA